MPSDYILESIDPSPNIFDQPGGVTDTTLDTTNSPDDSYGNIITDPATQVYPAGFVGPIQPGTGATIAPALDVFNPSAGGAAAIFDPYSQLIAQGVQSDSKGNVTQVAKVTNSSGGTSLLTQLVSSLTGVGASNAPKSTVTTTGLKTVAATPATAAASIGGNLFIFLFGAAALIGLVIAFSPRRR